MNSLNKFLKRDSTTRVDISKLNEMVYWTYKWKISPFQLLEAIKETKSNIVTKIEEYLKGRRLI